MRHLVIACGAIASVLAPASLLAQPCDTQRTTAWILDRVPIDPASGSGLMYVNQFRKWSIAADVDADGADDVILGLADCADLDCLGSAGAGPSGERRGVVQVISGRTGEMIRELVSPSPAMINGQNTVSFFGNNLAAADVNGDGRADIAVAAYAERIDLDNDGSLENTVGIVYVFDGATGGLLYSHPGQAPSDAMGWSLDFVGDWDGDGAPDLLVGRRNANNLALHLYSGATGAPLQTSVIGGSGYIRISNVGDVTGDEVDDAAVMQSIGLTNDTARLLYFADATLVPAAVHVWGQNSTTVHPVNLGDVDGDGLADQAFYGGDPLAGGDYFPPVVTVVSALTGAVIHEFSTPDPGWPFETRVAPLGDVNGDGAPDAAIGPFIVPDDDDPYEVLRVYSLIDGVCLGVWRTRDRSYFDSSGITGEIAHTYLSMASGDFDGDGRLDVAAVGIPQETFLQPDPMFLRQLNIFRRPGCPEDMTGDGFIGFADLSALLDAFNDIDNPGMLPADIDGDGQVTFADLNLILAAFNSGC